MGEPIFSKPLGRVHSHRYMWKVSKWQSNRNEPIAMMMVITANMRRQTELVCTGATGRNTNHAVLPLTAVWRDDRVTINPTLIL